MAQMDVVLRIADLKPFRLFLWELRQLQDEMRVMASPHADRLEHAIDRFIDGDIDEGQA
jgi:hypothetical protein